MRHVGGVLRRKTHGVIMKGSAPPALRRVLAAPLHATNADVVDRLFDLRHASKLDQIEAAANVLGKHVYVQIA